METDDRARALFRCNKLAHLARHKQIANARREEESGTREGFSCASQVAVWGNFPRRRVRTEFENVYLPNRMRRTRRCSTRRELSLRATGTRASLLTFVMFVSTQYRRVILHLRLVPPGEMPPNIVSLSALEKRMPSSNAVWPSVAMCTFHWHFLLSGRLCRHARPSRADGP